MQRKNFIKCVVFRYLDRYKCSLFRYLESI